MGRLTIRKRARKRTRRMTVGMLVRIRDTIMRTISPTATATAAAASSSSREVFTTMRGNERYLHRVRVVYSNCYNLVANTITRKCLAAKQRRSVLLQIIRPKRASRKEEASQLRRFTIPMYTGCRWFLYTTWFFYAAFVRWKWKTEMLRKDMTLDSHDADFHVKKLRKYLAHASKEILLRKMLNLFLFK